MYVYILKQEICCDGALYPNYGEEGEYGACCTIGELNITISYDTRCYECEKPLYDCTYQVMSSL